MIKIFGVTKISKCGSILQKNPLKMKCFRKKEEKSTRKREKNYEERKLFQRVNM